MSRPSVLSIKTCSLARVVADGMSYRRPVGLGFGGGQLRQGTLGAVGAVGLDVVGGFVRFGLGFDVGQLLRGRGDLAADLVGRRRKLTLVGLGGVLGRLVLPGDSDSPLEKTAGECLLISSQRSSTKSRDQNEQTLAHLVVDLLAVEADLGRGLVGHVIVLGVIDEDELVLLLLAVVADEGHNAGEVVVDGGHDGSGGAESRGGVRE